MKSSLAHGVAVWWIDPVPYYHFSDAVGPILLCCRQKYIPLWTWSRRAHGVPNYEILSLFVLCVSSWYSLRCGLELAIDCMQSSIIVASNFELRTDVWDVGRDTGGFFRCPCTFIYSARGNVDGQQGFRFIGRASCFYRCIDISI